MAFDPTDNPGRNKSNDATSTVKTITGASYYRPGDSGTGDRTVSNGFNIDTINLAKASSNVEDSVIEDWFPTSAYERSLTNFAYFLKNGKEAASVLTEKYNLANV